MATAFLQHPDCLLHDMGSHHPECPERLAAIADHFRAVGLLDVLQLESAPAVTPEQLLRVHDSEYLEFIEAMAPRTGLRHIDPDTAMNPHSLSAATHAAGALVRAVDMVISGEADNAFCNVRPPGHHACRNRAMGFCIYNNVAVGAAHALEAHGLERVAIVDFDVHHGNGTEDIFTGDRRVMMLSTFQYPFYPYSGVEGRSDRMVNIPLDAYSDGVEFRKAVEEHWLPAVEAFQPQMFLVSAGFDAHRDDGMASLGFVEDDYAWVTRRLVEWSASCADGRIVSTLEGGYHLPALARSAEAHVRVLCGL